MAHVIRLILVGVLVPVGVNGLIVAPLQAATITVNSKADVISSSDGQCTLREAILAANTNLASGAAVGECAKGDSLATDEIVFTNLPGSPDLYMLGIPPSALNDALTGDLNITEDVVITGNGQTETLIDGGRRDRVFRIEAGATVFITAVTIQHGTAHQGGGIANEAGTLTITNSTIRSNGVECAGVCKVEGGGLWNFGGTVEIFDGTIALNSARCTGSACDATGGGIANTEGGTVTLHTSVFSTNAAECTGQDCSAAGGGVGSQGTVRLLNQTSLQQANYALCRGLFCTAQGGGVFGHGGAIVLEKATVTTNWAICGGGHFSCRANGGGLASDFGGTLQVDASTVVDNGAFASCTKTLEFGCGAEGGGIHGGGDLTRIDDASVVSGNEARCLDAPGFCAARGGGLFASGSSVVVFSSTFSANSAEGHGRSAGGGIYSLTRLLIGYSAFSANVAEGPDNVSGGGIHDQFRLDVVNSTFSGNVAQCTAQNCTTIGGGLFNGVDTPAEANILFTTFHGNAAGCPLSPCVFLGGGIANSHGTVRIKESIVHGSILQDCFIQGTAFHALGANLDSDGSCPGFSLPGMNALLGPLAFNGGPTPTRALQAGSPAIDAASDCFDFAPALVLDDQRGIARPKGPACDLGAYERARFRLGASLRRVLELLTDRNAANDAAACGKLRAFLHQLRGHERRGELTPDEVDRLREAAERQRASAGCPGNGPR